MLDWLTHANDETQVAVAAAVISVLAAIISGWQLVLARRQVKWVGIDRHEARGPQFGVNSAHVDLSDVNNPVGHVELCQLVGEKLSSVVVRASGDGVRGLWVRGAWNPDTHARDDECVREQEIGPTAPGGAHELRVILDYDTRKTKIHLDLTCTDSTGSATWTRALQRSVAPLPPSNSPQRGSRYARRAEEL